MEDREEHPSRLDARVGQARVPATRGSVKRAYPAAKANNSTGVAGWDLFNAATRHYTRFSSFGIGATPDRLRYIQLACTIAGQC